MGGFLSALPGIGSLISGIEGLISGPSKATAATNAAGAQVAGAQQGISTLQGVQGQQAGNLNPYIQGGQTSLGQLLTGLSNGTYGTPTQAPQYTGGPFVAPTAAQAEATPGYQFTAQQGSKGILQGAAAAGGAISGGTLKALDSYNSGLASTTYGNTFNQALQTYGAGLQGYQAQLQGYGAQLQGNQQAFNQAFQPAQLGASAASSLNNSLTQTGEGIASEYNNIGNANAAGIIGSTNALWGGIQGGTAGITQGLGSLGTLFGGGYGGYGGYGGSGGGGGGSASGIGPMGGGGGVDWTDGVGSGGIG